MRTFTLSIRNDTHGTKAGQKDFEKLDTSTEQWIWETIKASQQLHVSDCQYTIRIEQSGTITTECNALLDSYEGVRAADGDSSTFGPAIAKWLSRVREATDNLLTAAERDEILSYIHDMIHSVNSAIDRRRLMNHSEKEEMQRLAHLTRLAIKLRSVPVAKENEKGN